MTKKILVVDDDEYIRSLLKEIFLSEGYEVDTEDNGQSGFEKACAGSYDLITMDLRMPNWDGMETIMGLNLVNNQFKFIIISGFVDEAKELLAEQPSHILAVIEKPFDVVQLLSLVKRHFQGVNNDK